MTRTEEKQLAAFVVNVREADLADIIDREYGTDFRTPARLAHAVWFGRAPAAVCADPRITAAQGDAIRSEW